ncbi:MAG: hypothetical protein IPN64_16240 [Propionivibrio sp.]|uniref:hypothetical protein n=1 Tax=Propionivibrio sp. TaxID=2212460 RepID=UPI0025E77096|nr:hypothetical protein [Propionivibrio sp.]MBK8895515.1 hypothetical protein [Propionivibrio sp.]
MSTHAYSQLAISAKANLRSKLSAQRGRSQTKAWAGAKVSTHAYSQLAISAKANLRSKLSALRGRSQDPAFQRGARP